MRLLPEWSPIRELLATRLPCLRPAQVTGLTWWVVGAVLAESACQTAILTALAPVAAGHALRQRLREWLADGTDHALPSPYQVEVTACFPWLLRWLLGWWQGSALALALDATSLGDRLVVLSVSVLYRGTAIPVAWHVLPANRPGTWLPGIETLFATLAPAIPLTMRVLVLTDRGLWSPRIWDRIRCAGWYPLLRIRHEATVRPIGQQRVRARSLVPGPGHAWIGAATIYRHKVKQRRGTVLVVWAADQSEPWILVTSLPATRVGPCWYALRTWIELGFRALKRLGWQWERTRRTDPDRVARHWLVLAVLTLLTVAVGTRVEDAHLLGRLPAQVRTPPTTALAPIARQVSVFAQGRSHLRWLLLHGRRLWLRLWLRPETWPDPPAELVIHRFDPRAGPLHS